ncbi:cysteine proteinase inhibitor 1-like [Prosopis cineraria]|uniref:cysteine proteinase inhibitor 1-like n=1 Tax=Prosopis cineraria TaxID=364024 RepID=UPI002410A407|nr:cysteine proteinase inhibitor 1-like [Prosopis cineraria]
MGPLRKLLLSLLLVPLCAISGGRAEAVIPGGWTPIPNLEDQHVMEIANFAVAEYDKRNGARLKLEKVVKGETQVVAGTNYRLVVATKDGSSSATKNYEAVVWEKPWQHFRNLTSFEAVQG